uniref:Adrenomedullin n=1 Tax=Vombatus ursinus TaxID=29139 RepID=A0A4X2K6K4_VOMUR
MQLVPVALIYLGSFAFLGADTARLDLASEFRKKWNKWALSRGKRELRVPDNPLASPAEVKAGPIQTFIRTQDVKGASRSPQPSYLTPFRPSCPQQSGRSPHTRQALPPEYEFPALPELAHRLPFWDMHPAELGAPDLPAHGQ